MTNQQNSGPKIIKCVNFFETQNLPKCTPWSKFSSGSEKCFATWSTLCSSSNREVGCEALSFAWLIESLKCRRPNERFDTTNHESTCFKPLDTSNVFLVVHWKKQRHPRRARKTAKSSQRAKSLLQNPHECETAPPEILSVEL